MTKVNRKKPAFVEANVINACMHPHTVPYKTDKIQYYVLKIRMVRSHLCFLLHLCGLRAPSVSPMSYVVSNAECIRIGLCGGMCISAKLYKSYIHHHMCNMFVVDGCAFALLLRPKELFTFTAFEPHYF